MANRGNPRHLVLPGLVAGPVLISAFMGCSSSKDTGSKGDPVEVYPGCENAGAAGIIPPTPNPEPPPPVPVTDEASLFAGVIQQNLGSCRPCHVAGGTADVDGGRRLLFTSDKNQDEDTLKAAWTALGGGVDGNPLLTRASGKETHSGGKIWTEGSTAFDDFELLLSCWQDPSGCAAGIAARPSSTGSKEHPLIGDLEANGGRYYATVFCEGKPDCATLPDDPRLLIRGENVRNPGHAVYYNEAFEVCETPALFANQKRGNDLLAAQGLPPAYTAKPRPKSCGEWRAAVAHGRDFAVNNPITGPVYTVNSLAIVARYLGLPFPDSAVGLDAAGIQAINDLSEKLFHTRYGWPKTPDPYVHPAPLPGEDPKTTDGGSLRLPIAIVQVKNDQGEWTGELGNTCFSCHQGMIGTGQVTGGFVSYDGHPELQGGSPSGLFLGIGGSNTDIGTALWDIDTAVGLTGPDSFDAVLNNPSWMTNRSRGANAADQEILSIIFTRDLDTLDFLGPQFMPQTGGKTTVNTIPNFGGGDQDVPTWWWLHNKTRWLWTGYGSNGSAREAFFPAGINAEDGHWQKRREADFQDQDQWMSSLEAPTFPAAGVAGAPAINTALAEQGAILFHKKDLWADPRNADIPKPAGGNGSCASCHGAYSPRFIHEPGYLPDPSLAGMAAYTVPLDVLGTDAAQSGLFDLSGGRRDPGTQGGRMWIGHPDGVEGYRMPEERAPGEGPFPAGTAPMTPEQWPCALGTLGGYHAPPLHGVWASAPYFHNGSVPTVWDVLAPDTRPALWQRQLVPDAEGMPAPGGSGIVYRGYDVDLARAYDYAKLGWKYTQLTCDPAADATTSSSAYYTSCVKDVDLSTTIAPEKNQMVADRTIFNTNGYGKGNAGHAWTKVLTDAERWALIEYLKTL